MDEALVEVVSSIEQHEDGRVKAAKFIEAAVVHVAEQLQKARDALPRLEEKLAKMEAYASLVVSDSEAAIADKEAEIETLEQRLNDTQELAVEYGVGV